MQTTSKTLAAKYREAGWWGDETLSDWLHKAVEKRGASLALVDQPDRLSLVDGNPLRLTFCELQVRVEALSSQLYNEGIRQDDIVLVQLPNIAELVIAYFALDRLGAIVSPLPVQYGPFELNHAIQALKPKGFLTTRRLKETSFAASRLPVFADVCPVFCFGDHPVTGSLQLDLETVIDLENWQTYVDGLKRSADDIFSICWTSGTTGQPKGVPRSHNHWRISGLATTDAADIIKTDVLLNPFPLVNMAAIGGFLFPWITAQCTLVLHHPFELPLYLNQIQSEKITYTIAPPAVLTMLLNERAILDAIDLSSLRAIGSGGAPLSEWMVSTFQADYSIMVANIFGSNEGLCLASSGTDLPDPLDRANYFPRFGLAGKVWQARVGEMTQTRLVDLDTREVVTEPGVRAELEIAGPSVFDGYWQAAEANQIVFSEDGYFRTGDVFEIPEEAGKSDYYRFVGRSKDIIVRGGMKISPDEIDGVLAGCPGINAVTVTGFEDPVLGERIGAAVVPQAGHVISLEDLTRYLTDQGMAVFKLPEKMIIMEALPVNATGKVLRAELRQYFDAS